MTEDLLDGLADGDGLRYFGVYPAIVTKLVDDKHLGRIQVKFPWLGTRGAADVRAWATLCTPYADSDQGLQILPEEKSQVVVAFEAGDLRRPYIVGAAWNGAESLPVDPTAANNLRVLRSRAKSLLEFDDTAGAAKVTLSLKSGHQVVLSDADTEITIQHSNGCSIVFDITGKIVVTANQSVEVHAPMLDVFCATSTFHGVVNCGQVNVDSSLTSPSYSMGAGNIL